MTIARGIQQGIFDWLGRDVGRRPAKKIFLGGFLENTKNVFWDFSDKDFGILEKCSEILEKYIQGFWDF